MECIKCWSKTSIIDSRESNNTRVFKIDIKSKYRRHKCKSCSELFSTYELSKESILKLITNKNDEFKKEELKRMIIETLEQY